MSKHDSLWDIKNDRSYKYDIKKSTPDKIHEPEIVWYKRFPIFPRVRKGLGYKDPKDYQYFVNKHGSLWDIKNDRSYKYDIKKSTPDKIHEPEIVWSKRFPISKVR